MGEQITLIPGVVAANTNIDLPSGTSKAKSLISVIEGTLAEGTPNTITKTTYTIVTAVPGVNEARLVDEDTIELGNATAATDILVVMIEPKGSVRRV